MIKKTEIAGYKCVIATYETSEKTLYMIYPQVAGFDEQWLQNQATRLSMSLVMVYVPLTNWNNDLTPWPEPPEAKGFEPFGGDAPQFFKILSNQIVPECEKEVSTKERILMGVSLAGLFTLWQWMSNDVFHSIACLSGSFWYKGFLDWFDRQPIPHKSGTAYFLLGVDEPKAKVKAYQTVGINTQHIVGRLVESGITTHFDWVPGNHFSNPMPRAEKALNYIGGSINYK